MDSSEFQLDLSGDFTIDLGSDPSCDVVIAALGPRHGMLKREGDRLFLKHIDTGAESFVNRRKVAANRWREVTRYDEILLGGIILNLSPKFFVGRDRLGVESSTLRYGLSGGRLICDGAYIRAEPGTLTAIIGPAGCGKTTFLNLLNGYLVPSEGFVRIGNDYDPYRHRHILRDFVGYVPQEDILLPELIVEEALGFRLRLKFPDMARDVRERLVLESCRQVGFSGDRLPKFLKTMVGGGGSRRRGLSGGERKRANIAQELISKPLVLFLDEPTSGLSSVDAEGIVELLHRLAREEGLTIIATVHQPSQAVFDHFDSLLVMVPGGRAAYYGPTRKAVEYFEQVTSSRRGAANAAEFILQQSLTFKGDRDVAGVFRSVRGGLAFVPPPLASEGAPAAPRRKPKRRLKPLREQPRQWLTLTDRNLRILFKDKANLALTLLQAPLVALLLVLAFENFAADTAASDSFARQIYFFDEAKAPLESAAKTLPVDQLLREAAAKAEGRTDLIGPRSAQRRGGIYFLLVAASLWFGTIGASREVVGEQSVLRRELRTCLSLPPYLGSKAFLQIVLRGLQTALLTGIASWALLDLSRPAATTLWLALWLVGVCASLLGLLISSSSPTSRVALTAVPLVMIPQLIFGGVLRPEIDIPQHLVWPKIMGALTIQRWGFEAALSADSEAGFAALREFLSANWSGRYWEVNVVRFELSSVHDAFFPPSAGDGLWLAAVILLVASAAFFVGSLGSLMWRIR